MVTYVVGNFLQQAGTHRTLASSDTFIQRSTGLFVTTTADAVLAANGTGIRFFIDGGLFGTGPDPAYGIRGLAGSTALVDIGATGRIHGNTAAIEAQAGWRIENDGTLSGGNGIVLAGSATVVNAGSIDALGAGIIGAFANISVTNTGTITAGDDGLRLGLAGSPGGPELVNSGSILGGTDSGDSGVELSGFNARVINSGSIQGYFGVSFVTAASADAELINTGHIGTTASVAVGRAVIGSNGQDFVTNAGTMTGDVSLQGGNDRYDGTLGRIFGAGTLGGEVFGGTGDDTLLGGDGRERLFGDVGADLLEGGGANDLLVGGNESDTLEGGDGDDVLRPGAGADQIDGGAGSRDMIDYLGSASVWVNLSTGEFALGDAAGDVASGIEWIAGSNTNDRLTGDGGANVLYGRGGFDILAGEAGHDVLDGGGLDDILRGGTGADVLRGGTGADKFAYAFTAESTGVPTLRDRILDFSRAEGDLIDIDAIDASTLLAGDQDFIFIGGAGFTAAGQVRFVVSGGNTLVSANTDGNTGTAEFSVLLIGAITLTAADFDL